MAFRDGKAKWGMPRKQRRSILMKLISLANRLRVEAVFPEDYKDVETLDEAIKFIDALSLVPIRGNCPICGEPTVTEGEVEPICFHGIGDMPLEAGKIEGLQVRHCESCGAYCVVGW